MKTFSSILILCFAFTFANAQDIAVNADFDQNADFNRFKTFSLVDRDEAHTGMDRHKDKTDRAEGERTGSGYGTQGATGATGTVGDQEMADDQTTRDRDQGVTGDHGTVRDQGTVGGTPGVTGDQEMDVQETDEADRDLTGERETYGTTGEKKSHAKMGKKKIKEAIKAEMESRGYTYTENNPDLLVNFTVFDGESGFVMGQDQNQYSAWGPQIGQGEQVNIEKGTIVVHLVDAQENQLVYQAYANGAAEEGTIQDEQRVKEVVSRMFDEIPSDR